MSNEHPTIQESQGLSTASMTTIKSNLDRLFGGSEWVAWELETISDTLGVLFDELLQDKISLLQVIGQTGTEILDNVVLFMHACDVINNKVADFEHLPLPNSLELAYALYEISGILGEAYSNPAPDSDLADALVYLLRQEGYSTPIFPFNFIDPKRLEAGQLPEDIESRKTAIKAYITHMETL